MDFVNHLIQEGYTEEEIGDILECMYIANNIDSLQLTEEIILEGKGKAIVDAIKALKNMPKNPWVARQIAKLQKLLKGSKSTADDALKSADDAFTSTRQGSKTYRPGSKPSSTAKPSKPGKPGKTGTGAAVATGAGAGLMSKIPNIVKGTASIATGALIGSQLPKSDDATSGNTTTPETEKEPKPEKEKEPTKPKFTMDYGWWKKLEPRRGYAANPGLGAYRNVRANEAYEIVINYLISEGHAESIEEANYVMNQMEFEHIVDIVEGK